ncbi:MAG: tRNA (N(6)-L-threonylcarbamoyladenosine(37)-C(2))-methylthiotransferase MtaB [Firmicutes bacterium]|nr:tRNA (N(6)-L-threonylcarbamoyladenosine(37)-C(2))-methylthiotransferase MtaB [Bacillota bacterium]
MKFYVYTLGCKSNQVESGNIEKMLLQHGFEVTGSLEDVDFFVINTCCVTHTSEKKSRQAVTKLLSVNPSAKVFVFGCASERDAKQFERGETILIWGTKNKEQFVEKILEIFPPTKQSGEKTMSESLTSFGDISKSEDLVNEGVSSKTRSFIKIQDGCDNYCSYCIVPLVRGSSRSYDIKGIIQEAAEKRTKEIILTGINISSYGRDTNSSLTALIKELKQINIRKRLSSLESVVIDEEFLKSCIDSNFCEHFHLSLQSGSNSVLKRMNRNYSVEEFCEKVNLIRKLMPNAAVTTDVIVGFGGESEKEFQETYDICKKLKFADMHIFPFSMRKGTKAEELPDVHAEIKKERVKTLGILRDEIRKEFLKSNLNIPHEVLVEEHADNYTVGYSRNYIKIYSNAPTKELLTLTPKGRYKDGLLV